MKRIAAAALLLLAACSGERASEADFYAVAPQVLRFAEQDARQNQPGRPADGPLYVNLNSFRRASDAIIGRPLPVDSIAQRLGDPTDALEEQVLMCDTMSNFGGCWLRKYGVWVSWNLAHGTPEKINATVRTSATDRRVHPSNFCHRVWRLTFRKNGGQWGITDRERIADCVDMPS